MISVGILANPASARDVRRLIAHASTVTVAERCSMIQRALIGLARMGVDRVLIMRDHGGIAQGLELAQKTEEKTNPCSGLSLNILKWRWAERQLIL